MLRTMFPNQTIPDPEAFFFPRWFSDPLYRGSYSNWPASFYSEHHDNLRATVNQRLWFAGEATSMKWFGKFILTSPCVSADVLVGDRILTRCLLRRIGCSKSHAEMHPGRRMRWNQARRGSEEWPAI